MSVVIETTLGDITVDLYLEQRPATCLNFLKLCKMKYYNFNLFHTIRSGFIAQTGDPTGEGSGGESIWGLLEGANKRFFSGEKMPKIRHTDAGLLSMVCTDDMMVGSQFFFTLGPDLDSLDGVHCVIGEVTEGHEVLTKLNEVICDDTHRPYQDVRITHTVILEDPFNDPPGLKAPSRSPSPNAERLRGGRIAPDEDIDETQGKSHQEIQEMIEEKEAKARATILEIVGDLPDADVAPPENVLFVCKLNPVTTDDDLEIIFSRFGKIVSCEVIRDKKSGDSLQYAFIEFEDKKSCEDAYFKMDNVLIDDRRIHVDFSQSVSKMRWLGKGRGVQYLNNKSQDSVNMSTRSHSKERERNDGKSREYKKHREDRHNVNQNDKRSDSVRNENDRSRKRRYSPQNKTKNDSHYNEHSNTKEYRTEKSNKYPRSSIKNENSIRHVNDRSRLRKSSPNRYEKREYSRSPLRNEEDKEDKRKDKKEKGNDKYTSNNHKSDGKQESNYKEKKSNKDIVKPKTAHKKSSPQEANEVEPHTPSPVSEKNNLKATKSEKGKLKNKNNIKSHKAKRKPSTSSSESETSDTSSSSSESSSSSREDKKKRVSKIKKRHSSSSSSSSSTSTSSSTSSTSSSSSSSDSSSDSSNSSSDSECNKKKPKKSENRKCKKPKKKL